MQVFIDLGSHFGAIISKFIASKSYTKGCEIHAFEPNPVITENHFMRYPAGVIIHRKAAWIKDGSLDFYINHDPRVQGSSVCRDKITGDLDKKNPVKIECIDFGAWLLRSFKAFDEIILKMNIEGAEYELLPKMINDGSIGMIKKLYLRHHWQKIGFPKSIDDKLMERLSVVPGLQVFDTYCF